MFFNHEIIDIESIIPFAMNSRLHSDAQVAQLAASIREFGFTNPVLIDEDKNLIAGHGRVMAARKLGLKSVPAILVTGLDERKRRALVIADNKLAMNATWDEDVLKNELQDLAGDFGELMGFSQDELDSIFAEFNDSVIEGETEDDEIPSLPEKSTSVLGDIWILGRHRLMCGDSTSLDAVEKLTDGKLVDMVWTDPPYNVAYEGGTGMTIQNDDMSDGQFKQFLTDAFLTAFAVTKKGGPIYIAHADSEGINFRTAMTDAGWDQKQTLIWVKNSLVMGRQDYQWQHEPILYGWKPGAAHCWYGFRNKTTVINDDVKLSSLDKKELIKIITSMQNAQKTTIIKEDKPHRNDIHPTMKPVALVQTMLENSSQERDVVLDLFGGGGSTLIASEKTNRQARLMELDPKYCDVIVKRWEDFTGKKATHADTGKTFAEHADGKA
jgi:DNA modification methylase